MWREKFLRKALTLGFCCCSSIEHEANKASRNRQMPQVWVEMEAQSYQSKKMSEPEVSSVDANQTIAASPSLLTFIKNNAQSFPNIKYHQEKNGNKKRMLLKNRPSRNNPYALWIRSLINQHHWSFERLAHQLGASFASVKNWYFGRTTPMKFYRKLIQDTYEEQQKKKEHN
jgi:DNA-binding transcriptional regulator YiaG